MQYQTRAQLQYVIMRRDPKDLSTINMTQLIAAVLAAASSFGRLGRRTTDATAEVHQLVTNSSVVVVFAADYCPYCRRVVLSLSEAAVPHVVHDASSRRAALRDITQQRTIPYVFLNGVLFFTVTLIS